MGAKTEVLCLYFCSEYYYFSNIINLLVLVFGNQSVFKTQKTLRDPVVSQYG